MCTHAGLFIRTRRAKSELSMMTFPVYTPLKAYNEHGKNAWPPHYASDLYGVNALSCVNADSKTYRVKEVGVNKL